MKKTKLDNLSGNTNNTAWSTAKARRQEATSELENLAMP
jgi:hypothetical protein